MKRLILCCAIPLVAGVAAAGASAPPMASSIVETSSTPCLGPDELSNHFLEFFQTVVPGTWSATDSMRAQYSLPKVDSSAITLVADSTTCSRGLSTYRVAFKDSTLSGVYVYRVGTTRYVLLGGSIDAGRHLAVTVDTSFSVLARVWQ